MEEIKLDLFSPKKAELQKMAQEFKDLKINGIDDKKGFKLVHEAQMKLRDTRILIQNTRKDYTKQFDEAKKTAMDLEKELLEIIVPLENSLKEQKDQVELEKAKIEQEEREKKRKFLQNRVDELAKYNYVFSDLFKLSEMSEEDFKEEVERARGLFTAQEVENNLKYIEGCFDITTLKEHFEGKEVREIVKNKLDEKILKLEEEKKARKELEEQQAKLKADQDKLDADRLKIQQEKDEIEKQKEIEQARKEGEEKQRQLQEERKINTDKFLEQNKNIQDKKEIHDQIILMRSSYTFEKERAIDFLQSRFDEIEQKERQEEQEKEQKYQAFLKKNEGNYDYILRDEGKAVLYKKIDQYTF